MTEPLEEPPKRTLRALARLDAPDVAGMDVQPASIPAGLGCRPGDFLLKVDADVADRWVAAGLAEVWNGAVPAATRERE